MSRKLVPSPRSLPESRPPRADGRPHNRLIGTLPAEDFRRIVPHLTTVSLSAKQVLLKRGDPIRYVFFPNGGVCSVTAMMKNGAAVEVATVGDEGMVGMLAFFGDQPMPGDSDRHGTTAERMPVDAFRRELNRHGALDDRLKRHLQAKMALMAQSTACMALHHVNKRCCRWLLMTHDRIKADQFELSHEFLAMMLGSTRPTLTLVAGTLQKAGLVRYTHARMTILDRAGLEAASCECYSTVKTAFDQLGL